MPDSRGSMQCQLCYKSLAALTADARQAHYEGHFLNEPHQFMNVVANTPEDAASGSSNGETSKNKRKWKERLGITNEKELDVFWYTALTNKPPRNYTPGGIVLLKKSLLKLHARGKIERAALCYIDTVHVCRQTWDAGWGCGYRNFIMCCTALMGQPFVPTYFPVIDSALSPGIRSLQRLIEAAWIAGYDKEGAKQLKKLVDTSKWIGTSDLCTAFSYIGIPAQLVDFDLTKSPRGVDVLLDWVVDYFSTPSPYKEKPADAHGALLGASPVVCTDHMPLILQHLGHSRTVVGYEKIKGKGVNLIVFDPSSIPNEALRKLCIETAHTSASSTTTANLLPLSGLQSSNQASVSGSASKRGAHELISPSGVKRPCSENRSTSGGQAAHDAIVIEDDDGDNNYDDVDEDVVFMGENKRVAGGSASKKYHSSSSSMKIEDIDAADIVRHHRLERKRLMKWKQFQILYFPMRSPLTDTEKDKLKILRSLKVT